MTEIIELPNGETLVNNEGKLEVWANGKYVRDYDEMIESLSSVISGVETDEFINTMYRFKTEDEFINDWGEDFRWETGCNLCSQGGMDYLFGRTFELDEEKLKKPYFFFEDWQIEIEKHLIKI